MEGDVDDNLCVLVQLVSILKNVQLFSIIRHNMSINTNKKRKQKGKTEYMIIPQKKMSSHKIKKKKNTEEIKNGKSIEMKKYIDIMKKREKGNKQNKTCPNRDIHRCALSYAGKNNSKIF